ncbi:MAG: acyltransferase [Ardenticatenaceae bacterium]|nr:acyltransferase [Ardenticatenaceae bacterium]MCB8950086.1 acyltransferase [Ardenticatenaceae bacterium]
MNKSEAEKPEARRWQGYTLEEYVVLRNGVPLGDGRSLRNMLERSFGAASFAGFWQYWNPIWGYGLGRYVYAPLRRVLPPAVAFILTFAISGGLHDLATMAVRWSPAFLFTPWFVLLGMGAVVGRVAGMDLGQRPFWLRAAVNLAYLVVCLLPALALRNAIL